MADPSSIANASVNLGGGLNQYSYPGGIIIAYGKAVRQAVGRVYTKVTHAAQWVWDHTTGAGVEVNTPVGGAEADWHYDRNKPEGEKNTVDEKITLGKKDGVSVTIKGQQQF
jgi:hypothetical protein